MRKRDKLMRLVGLGKYLAPRGQCDCGTYLFREGTLCHECIEREMKRIENKCTCDLDNLSG